MIKYSDILEESYRQGQISLDVPHKVQHYPGLSITYAFYFRYKRPVIEHLYVYEQYIKQLLRILGNWILHWTIKKYNEFPLYDYTQNISDELEQIAPTTK